MKRLLSIAVVALSLICCPLELSGQDNPSIPIVLEPDYSEKPLRSLSERPINALYSIDSGYIEVSFAYPLGNVVVTIENLNTGGYVQDTISSIQGVAFLDTPDDYGNCVIRLFLPDGSVYVGLFRK